MSVNSVGEADESCVCVTAGGAANTRIAVDAATQQIASVHGKSDLPRELNFTVDPCVDRQVSLGNANDCDALTAWLSANPPAGTLVQIFRYDTRLRGMGEI